MENLLDLLLGVKLSKAEVVHDYLQLRFENGVILNVFNAFRMREFSIDDLSKISGCEICAVRIDETSVEFEFLGGGSIWVGMSDDDYQGPEAMEYIGAAGDRVVWS